MQSKIGVHIIHGHTLYMGKYGTNSRFEDSRPVLGAFQTFDSTTVPERSDLAFKDYGAEHINFIANYFSQAEM